jgi:hypothetical protein
VYFLGNAPTLGSLVFEGIKKAIVYFLPGTTGWASTFCGLPTAPWIFPTPWVLTGGPGFGIRNAGFSFTISWVTNVPVVIEACTDLAHATWSPLVTNSLNGGINNFSDPQWTNYPVRFYRIRSP